MIPDCTFIALTNNNVDMYDTAAQIRDMKTVLCSTKMSSPRNCWFLILHTHYSLPLHLNMLVM